MGYYCLKRSDMILKINHWLGYLFAITLLSIVLYTAHELFIHGQFTSDGMHDYSAIRNLAFFHSLWEGPTFEYLLGNHSYLTMFILAPIIKLFPTPLVLAYVNVLTHFSSAFLLFYCGQTLNYVHNRVLLFLLAILYLAYITAFGGFFYEPYMFQPDCFLAPLLILLFFAILKEKNIVVYVSTALIILTKEEYIPLLPIIIFCFFHLKWILQEKTTNRKLYIILCIIYLSCSLISLMILFHFRNLNEINHAAKTNFLFDVLISPIAWSVAFHEAMIRLFPVSSLFVLLFFIKPRKSALCITFYLAAFTVGRFMLNQIVYGNLLGSSWGNTLITPMIFILIFCMMSLIYQNGTADKYSRYSVVLFILCFLSLYPNQQEEISKIKKALNHSMPENFNLNDVESIHAKMDKVIAPGYIVTLEFLMSPFMERSHVVAEWLATKDWYTQNKILKNADYVILPLTHKMVSKLEEKPENFKVVVKTNTLICFQPVKE